MSFSHLTEEDQRVVTQQTQRVLDHGYVRIDEAMADDLSVVNSARVSFNKRVDTLGPADKGLIKFLMRDHHGTPFEHNSFRFEIKAPIFIAREWMRHRIGSFNEWSGRYSELEKEFYVPALQDVRTQVGKPGAYTFEPVDEATADGYCQTVRYANEVCWGIYQDFITGLEAQAGQPASGPVAKELARLVLPLNIYTKFYWTINARALMNFIALRNEPHAMLEIQRYAAAIENIFEWKMPVTHAAFVEQGRVAP